jgi:pimeloyl-ACP methyl ester carboxylesterase
MVLKKILPCLLFSLLLFTCKEKKAEMPVPVTDNTILPPPAPGDTTTRDSTTLPIPSATLVESEKRNFYDKESLKSAAGMLGYGDLTGYIKYSAQSYLVKYKTRFMNKEITASGLLFVPDNSTSEMPILSFQHGTTFKKSDAPSSSSYSEAVLLSAAGYITLVPDYIGYGISASEFHPYYIKEYSAGVVVDLIRAGREFLKNNSIHFKNKIFLAGYSEGGYVSMAAQETIEKNYPDINLIAVAAGAGGFDLNSMLADLTSDSNYPNPGYLSFLLTSFDICNNWGKGPEYFFGDSFENKFPVLLNGSYSASYINNQLTTDLNNLLDSAFYSDLKKGGEEFFRNEINENSIGTWPAHTPIRIYHGTADEIVPYKNSASFSEKLKSSGASSVTFIPIQNGTHGSSFKPMAVDFLNWFEMLK